MSTHSVHHTWDSGVHNCTIGIAKSFPDINFLRTATLWHEFVNSKSHWFKFVFLIFELLLEIEFWLFKECQPKIIVNKFVKFSLHIICLLIYCEKNCFLSRMCHLPRNSRNQKLKCIRFRYNKNYMIYETANGKLWISLSLWFT